MTDGNKPGAHPGFHSISVSKGTFQRTMANAKTHFQAQEHQNEEPFRVMRDNAQLFRDRQLTQIVDDIELEKEQIVSAKFINNNVVFIGEPYNLFVQSGDCVPVDLKGSAFGQFGGGNDNGDDVDIIDEDAEQDFENDQAADDLRGQGGLAPSSQGHAKSVYSETVLVKKDEFDARSMDNMSDQLSDDAPKSFASQNGPDFVNNNGMRGGMGGRGRGRGGLSRGGNSMGNGADVLNARPYPNNPSMSGHMPRALAQGSNMSSVNGASYKDQNGLERHIGLSQDMILSNVLNPGPSQGGHQAQFSGASNGMGPNGMVANGMGGAEAPFDNVRMGHQRTGSQGSHVSSHSRTSHHSHGVPMQTNSGPYGDEMDDIDIDEDDDDDMGNVDNQQEDSQSVYSMDYEPSVGTFVGLPRQKVKGGDGYNMSYVKGGGDGNGGYHSIPKSQLKSPLIFNQIANDIQIKRSKSQGVKKIRDNIIITKFPDARPKLDRNYFKMSKGVRGGLVVVIPFFNEPATELEATLRHLYTTYSWMCEADPAWKTRPMDVCMIQDGWSKASDSMHRYLKKMFPKQYYIDPVSGKEKNVVDDNDLAGAPNENENEDAKSSGGTELPEITKYWWEHLKEFTDYDKGRDGSVTYVFEKTHDNPSYFELKFAPNPETGKIDKRMEVQKHFRITLIVKIDNRRKHNSHEWFLGENGFSDAYQARYLFATDAFTLYEDPCMYHMCHYLDTHPDTAAVTGRQRAMDRVQQNKHGKEFILSIEYMLRMTQTFDFELTSGVFNPVYGVVGFLPVVPGPCGLYRCSDISQNKARYWYFDIVNAEPTETGLVLGNLRIAEDRILTYAAILKVKDYRRMAFVPAALFFFETETNIDSFIFQRRRWINGTFAGFIYILISAPYHVWGWHANFWIKFKVWLLLVINFAQLSTVVLSPAISFSILGTSLSYLLFWFTDEALSLADNIMLFGWILWCLHVIIHNTAKFSHVIIKLLYAWSFLISASLIVTYFLLFAIEGKDVYEGLLVDGMAKAELDFILGLMAFGTVVPFSCAYMVGGWEGVWILALSVAQYFLSFHLMIPWFTSYAFARCWDLTWGNRPAEGEMDEVEAEKFEAAEIMKAKFLQYSRIVAFALIVCNIGLFLLPAHVIILTMSGFLMATAFFMGSSFVVLVTQTFCGECLTNILSRSLEEYRKAEERERQEAATYGNDVGMGDANFHDENADFSDSDEEYVVIPQEYQAQGTVVSRNIGPYGNEMGPNYDPYAASEFENGRYDDDGTWIDYNEENATHNNFNQQFDNRSQRGIENVDNVDNMDNVGAVGGAVGSGFEYDENGGYYDENGNYIVGDDTGAYEETDGYYDENGVWVPATQEPEQGYEHEHGYQAAAGNEVANDEYVDEQYDANEEENGGYYDENGVWVAGYYDENGNFVYEDANDANDPNGNYDENGNYYDPNQPQY